MEDSKIKLKYYDLKTFKIKNILSIIALLSSFKLKHRNNEMSPLSICKIKFLRPPLGESFLHRFNTI